MPPKAKSTKPTGLAQEGVALEWYLRAKAERSSRGLFSDAQPELTLDEAREEFAKAIARAVRMVAADRFGPLVGTFTETTIVATLKGFEQSAQQVRNDTTATIQEIIDRVIAGNPQFKREKK